MRHPRHRVFPVVALLAVAVGCSDTTNPTAPTVDESFAPLQDGTSAQSVSDLTVMSRNVYLGGDTDPLLTLDFSDIPGLVDAVDEFWTQVEASSYPERAEILADEIVRHRPHAVGLQEVLDFVILDLSGGAPVPVARLDLLGILQAELAERGANYELVEVQSNTTAVLPMSLGPGGIETALSFTDRIALLVRSDVEVSHSASDNYAASFVVGDPPAQGVELKRGWIRASVPHGGQTWNLVTTHFEIQSLAPVQAGQLAELSGAVMAGLQGPTILMGDLNSDAEAEPTEPSWTPSYETLLAEGFADTWTRGGLRSGPGGYTCCNDSDLMNGPGSLDRRIDFVLVRSENPDLARHSEARVVGDRPSDRTATGLWPSDHAGVVTQFRTPPGLQEH